MSSSEFEYALDGDSSPEATQYAELVEELRITKASSIPGLKERVRRYAILWDISTTNPVVPWSLLIKSVDI